MSTNDPVQRQLIREAMQAIAERKPGRSKLVYDKAKRTIVAVAAGSQTPQALNITADDADMFGVVTLSAEWIREQWLQLKSAGFMPVTFSSWDDGDALTHSELCVQASPATVRGTLLLDQHRGKEAAEFTIVLEPTQSAASEQDVFVSPDGAAMKGRVA